MPKLPKRPAIVDYKNNVAYLPLGRFISHGFVMVDAEDAWLDKYWWHTDTHGYAITNAIPYVRGERPLYLHALICKVRKGYTVDHINRDILDNRKVNLREATVQENAQNRAAHKLKNKVRTSKYKGVCKVHDRKNEPWKYSVYNKLLPKGLIYGYATTEREAALKYNELAKIHHGTNAVLNEVE